MIHVNKPHDPRSKYMRDKAVKQTNDDCDAYDLNSDAYHSTEDDRKKLPVVESIYKAAGVKDTLIEANYAEGDKKIGKCYFCESHLPRRDLHIEHFHPKNGFKKSRDSDEEYPGYYWLAYDWDNLLLGCSECNGIKGTIFPLANEGRRAHSHRDRDKVSLENPLLINPTEENKDPRDHIRFLDDAPDPQDRKGQKTIELLRLDGGKEGKERPFLKEKRLNLWNILRFRRGVYEKAKLHCDDAKWKQLADEARDYLEKATLPESEFSSMAQDFLSDWEP